MTYIKTYSTKQEAVDDTTVIAPNVSYCEENGQVLYGDFGLDIGDPLDIVYDGSGKLKYSIEEEN